VGHPPFAGKPVVILHADRGSSWALDSLREVLRTMSANVIAGASVSLALGTNRLEACGILAREDLRSGLQTSITVLFEVLSRESHGLRDATAP
jgi:NAD(P)H-dependent FMN reductase